MSVEQTSVFICIYVVISDAIHNLYRVYVISRA